MLKYFIDFNFIGVITESNNTKAFHKYFKSYALLFDFLLRKYFTDLKNEQDFIRISVSNPYCMLGFLLPRPIFLLHFSSL